MVKLLLKCPKCNKYYLDKTHIETSTSMDKKDDISFCSTCQNILKTPHPPKFSMENKYLKYIRKLKEQKKGSI